MIVQAVLLGIVAFVAQSEYALGTSLLSRPIVTGLFTGIVLGDVKTGIIMGATLELAFIGSFSVGASIPPDVVDRWDFRDGFCYYSWSRYRNRAFTRVADCYVDIDIEKYLLRAFDSNYEPQSRQLCRRRKL